MRGMGRVYPPEGAVEIYPLKRPQTRLRASGTEVVLMFSEDTNMYFLIRIIFI